MSEDRQSKETASGFQRVDSEVAAIMRSEQPISNTPYVGTRSPPYVANVPQN